MDKEDKIADLTTAVVVGISTACKETKMEPIDAIRVAANAFWTLVLVQSNIPSMKHNVECAAEIMESGKRAALHKAEELAFDEKAKSGPVGTA
jgi:hypothetical protein